MTKKRQKKEDENQSVDLPQKITESYGTGVKDLPGYNVGQRSGRDHGQEYIESSPEFPAEYNIIADEVDVYWQETVGDEAVGGTVATPEHNITEELEAAVGLEINDDTFLHTKDILEHRDEARWELDPRSAEVKE
ncbi:DUF6335 family protein [Anabaena lutea]|uniref:Uncharacterized protein n=1 Tax=Anabaena lutea FACHB-196 TaxID=2692881 RepID=A0ABR8FBJ7_9NOST|nr:DUF6335 family protein [Anabaena lutea]MBD2567588.1 hypothetical protein [Anabaena lutea FACHB-196]